MATLDDRVPVWRTMLVFIVPLLLSSILQAASGTITNIYLARLIDMRAFAAGATILPVLYLLVSLIVGLSSASSIVVGQAKGAGDEDGIRRAAGTGLVVAFGCGSIVGGVAFVFVEQILLAVGVPRDILPGAMAYARVSFATMPILFVFYAYSGLLRGLGDSRTPLVVLSVTEVLFIGTTPLLILGAFGLPRLGIAGMPVANAFGMLASTMGLWIWLEARRSPLSFGAVARHLWPDWNLTRKLFHIGVPTGVQMMVVSLAEVAVISFVNRFGSQATAAFGAVNQLLTYIQFPAQCLAAAAGVFGAQSVGAGRLDRLPQVARNGFLLNYAIGGGAVALCYVFARPLLSLFLTDQGTLGTAQGLLYIALWGYVVYGNTSVLTGLMRSNGTVLWPTIANVSAIWAVQVPLAWALSHGPLGLQGIWVAYPVAFCCAFVAVFALYQRLWSPRLRMTGGPADLTRLLAYFV